MPAAQRAFVLDPKYRWIGLVVLGVVIVGLIVAWPFFRPATTPDGLATDACKKAVLNEADVSASARFEDVQTSNTTQSMLFLGLEEVTDMAVNGFVVDGSGGSAVTQRFVCRTHIDDGRATVTDLTVD